MYAPPASAPMQHYQQQHGVAPAAAVPQAPPAAPHPLDDIFGTGAAAPPPPPPPPPPQQQQQWGAEPQQPQPWQQQPPPPPPQWAPSGAFPQPPRLERPEQFPAQPPPPPPPQQQQQQQQQDVYATEQYAPAAPPPAPQSGGYAYPGEYYPPPQPQMPQPQQEAYTAAAATIADAESEALEHERRNAEALMQIERLKREIAAVTAQREAHEARGEPAPAGGAPPPGPPAAVHERLPGAAPQLKAQFSAQFPGAEPGTCEELAENVCQGFMTLASAEEMLREMAAAAQRTSAASKVEQERQDAELAERLQREERGGGGGGPYSAPAPSPPPVSRAEQEQRDLQLAMELQQQERGGRSPRSDAQSAASSVGHSTDADEELARALQRQEQLGLLSPAGRAGGTFRVAEARVVGREDRGGATFFTVEVVPAQGPEAASGASRRAAPWRLSKRYSMFAELHARCVACGHRGAFPPKTIGKAGGTALEMRQLALNAWLEQTVKKAHSAEGAALQPLLADFLDARSHVGAH